MLAHGARCLCSAAGAWKGLLAQGLEQRRFHTTSRAPELGAKSVKVTQGGKVGQAAPRSAETAARRAESRPRHSESGACTRTQRLEVVFDDGQHIGLSAEYLRVMSPSADTRDRKDARGQQRVVSGRRRVAIIGAEHVGSYALRFVYALG